MAENKPAIQTKATKLPIPVPVIVAAVVVALALGACATGLVAAVAGTDRIPWLPRPAQPDPSTPS